MSTIVNTFICNYCQHFGVTLDWNCFASRHSLLMEQPPKNCLRLSCHEKQSLTTPANATNAELDSWNCCLFQHTKQKNKKIDWTSDVWPFSLYKNTNNFQVEGETDYVQIFLFGQGNLQISDIYLKKVACQYKSNADDFKYFFQDYRATRSSQIQTLLSNQNQRLQIHQIQRLQSHQNRSKTREYRAILRLEGNQNQSNQNQRVQSNRIQRLQSHQNQRIATGNRDYRATGTRHDR